MGAGSPFEIQFSHAAQSPNPVAAQQDVRPPGSEQIWNILTQAQTCSMVTTKETEVFRHTKDSRLLAATMMLHCAGVTDAIGPYLEDIRRQKSEPEQTTEAETADVVTPMTVKLFAGAVALFDVYQARFDETCKNEAGKLDARAVDELYETTDALEHPLLATIKLLRELAEEGPYKRLVGGAEAPLRLLIRDVIATRPTTT